MNSPGGNVFDAMICPDCGGRVGGTGADGHKPCKCFSQTKRPAARVLAPPPMEAPAPAKNLKVCRVCAMNLEGRARLRDDLGYLCKKCADAEDKREAGLIKCPECERRLKPGAFVEYRGTEICKRCFAYHQDNDTLKVAKVELVHHEAHERKKIKTLLILLGIAGVLVVISLLKTFRVM